MHICCLWPPTPKKCYPKMHIHTTAIRINIRNVADRSRGEPEDSLFNSYYSCKGRHCSFPFIIPLTLDLHLMTLSIKQGGI